MWKQRIDSFRQSHKQPLSLWVNFSWKLFFMFSINQFYTPFMCSLLVFLGCLKLFTNFYNMQLNFYKPHSLIFPSSFMQYTKSERNRHFSKFTRVPSSVKIFYALLRSFCVFKTLWSWYFFFTSQIFKWGLLKGFICNRGLSFGKMDLLATCEQAFDGKTKFWGKLMK